VFYGRPRCEPDLWNTFRIWGGGEREEVGRICLREETFRKRQSRTLRAWGRKKRKIIPVADGTVGEAEKGEIYRIEKGIENTRTFSKGERGEKKGRLGGRWRKNEFGLAISKREAKGGRGGWGEGGRGDWLQRY